MFFASDNGSACPPQVMDALLRENSGPAMPYGKDETTARVTAQIREIFEAPEAAVHFVATGTAANALALATLTPPWGAIFCHQMAHVNHDECAAPEFYSQAKLWPVAGADGRMDPAALEAAIRSQTKGSVHSVQPGAVTLTDVTELGTLLTPARIAPLAAVAKAHDLPVHLDGARFANAVAASGATPAELTWKSGVDVLSFGGTKGGLMGAEAVIFFDPKHSWEFQLRRKRGGHLFSKGRFLSAQFGGWLADGLWLDLARHANAMCEKLTQGLAALPGVSLAHPAEANIAFVTLPEAAHARLRAAGATYYQQDEGLARLVTSWATTEAEVEAFIATARG